MTSETTIYSADSVQTLDPARPETTAVAVRDGHVLATGTPEELPDDAVVDDRYADAVLVPGFVEAHTHAMGIQFWSFPYVGYHERRSPDGDVVGGYRTMAAVLDRLREHEATLDDGEPLVAWGLEPLFFDDDGLDADRFEPMVELLDTVSETRPVFLLHLSGHVAFVNSALLSGAEIDEHADEEFVVTEDGSPTGELREFAGMKLTGDVFARLFGAGGGEALRAYGRRASRVGCTTVADLGGPRLHEPAVRDRWQRVVSKPDFPVRIALAYNPSVTGATDLSHDEVADLLLDLRGRSTDKLRFGIAKLILDGSIQGFTARLRPPHYHVDGSNGIWNIPPDELVDVMRPYHEAGLTIFCHCNGDEASERFIDAVEQLQRETPRPDHRHTIQHCQLATREQYRRMANLGICANVFSNHVYYYGDQHYRTTVGPGRAERMDACRTAGDEGVPFTMHSDFPITPLDPLFTAWCAVTRVTDTGRILGEHERISVRDALEAMTLGGAYTLGMDDEIGTIEPGKRADFTVLERDPLDVDPMELKDVGVRGTVVGGRPFDLAADA
jgi:predicted amidohydrolase YtcJ